MSHAYCAEMEEVEEELVCVRWGDGEEDDVTRLPRHWEARIAADGRVFFLK